MEKQRQSGAHQNGFYSSLMREQKETAGIPAVSKQGRRSGCLGPLLRVI